MSDFDIFPRQGEIYLCRASKQSGDTKKRPVVVVSLDVRNQYSSTVLVVPFSSFIEGIENNPCRVLVKKGEGGLMVDSVAMADLITNIKKNYLESSVYGVISQSYLTKIQRAISLSMGVFL
ncbi:type II toxin-antitoxin system PemK/MazF family toxin [Cyanobacterium aponinum FACHB-4101]|uniref:type II toxin-antitoxin system PemK/MazF family toxin n=1 Tax=Cyanobacterium aponinum TaxID=379064 RepID=UPI00167FEF0F|nr:type II toxin-antitoxin system PemK/MazF family toxin [Cyanobacterium aponinum]MBD2395602.1 type II toxin-antitoxin system PemK/MazF family toxin [Cyanobacterium aponinum FACHB-4101]